MINRKNRFHGHNSVSRVRGPAVHSDLLSFRFAKNPKRKDYRLAVVVSKKVAPTAVQRNRIRRRLYEIVRKSARFQNTPIDLIIYVKLPEVSTLDATLLQKEVDKLSIKVLQRV